MKVWLYAAPNSVEFVHDLRYSQTWEYEWISQVFWGDKNLGYVGVICNFEGALSLPIHSRYLHPRLAL
jgi:hypothetical protein